MNLLLSGGGSPEETAKLDQLFVDFFKEGKILFIPIAKTSRTPKECYDWVKKIFMSKGFSGEMTLLSDLNNIKFDEIKRFDAIYIGGGNTFHLLKEIKSSGFDRLLKEYIKNEGTIYGVSAGAMIFCKDVNYAKEIGDMNEEVLIDTSSLNILKDLYIWPHYRSDQDYAIRRLIKKDNIQIIALPEGSGIYIKKRKVYVKSDNVYLFTKEKKSGFEEDEIIPDIHFNPI